MQTSRGGSMEDGQSPLANWVKENASTAKLLSVLLLIFAAWATVEIVTNVVGNEIPPVTGMETNDDPDDTQRINNGVIVGFGAVAGTLGIVLRLLLPEHEVEDVSESMPEEDEEIDEVVDDMMEDIGSDDNDEKADLDDVEVEIDDEDVDDEEVDVGGSLEEGDEVPEVEGDQSEDDDSPEEEEKTPVKKRKF